MPVEGTSRPAWADVDVAALRSNAAHVAQRVGGASLCAVVKADGYGHGAVASAEAFLAGGATSLAVALVDEGVELRDAGITAPILLLSEPTADAMEPALAAGLIATLTTPEGVEVARRAATKTGAPHKVHVKIDTGMHRMGVDPSMADALISSIHDADGLVLVGLWTHLAVADEDTSESRAFTEEQLAIFDAVGDRAARGQDHPLVRHAANSAAALAVPGSRYEMVRCGIALYGESPSDATTRAAEVESPLALTAAMTLRARVSAIHDVQAGARPSYGRRRPMPHAGRVATVPIGYADGFGRALFDAGQEVLISGRRYPLAGSVTMDQILVDVGRDPIAVGDEVVLLGAQGSERITAREWADHLGTITYEVLCGIGPRVPRRESFSDRDASPGSARSAAS